MTSRRPLCIAERHWEEHASVRKWFRGPLSKPRVPPILRRAQRRKACVVYLSLSYNLETRVPSKETWPLKHPWCSFKQCTKKSQMQNTCKNKLSDCVVFSQPVIPRLSDTINNFSDKHAKLWQMKITAYVAPQVSLPTAYQHLPVYRLHKLACYSFTKSISLTLRLLQYASRIALFHANRYSNTLAINISGQLFRCKCTHM